MKKLFFLSVPSWIMYSVLVPFAVLGLMLSLGQRPLPAIVVQSGVNISHWQQMVQTMLDFALIGF